MCVRLLVQVQLVKTDNAMCSSLSQEDRSDSENGHDVSLATVSISVTKHLKFANLKQQSLPCSWFAWHLVFCYGLGGLASSCALECRSSWAPLFTVG